MIVQACLNGAHPPAYHPRLPTSIQALATDGRQSVAAGASELHIHVRDQNGVETLHPEWVDATIKGLKAQLPGTLIGISTGAWIEKDDERVLMYVDRWRVLPDYASVNLSENNAPALIETLHRVGIGVEAGFAEPGDAERLVSLGLERFALRVLVEVDEQEVDQAHAIADEILLVLQRSKANLAPRFGHLSMPLLKRAVTAGFSVRVGLEDVSVLPDGSSAGSNADLVAAAVDLLRSAAADRAAGRETSARPATKSSAPD
jgi:uncharacterized protein (DUF849 family)